VSLAVAGDVAGAVPHGLTREALLDALEARYPMLRGTIRDRATLKRRPFVRYFACERDLSHDPPDTQLTRLAPAQAATHDPSNVLFHKPLSS
jgi:hypothetical protein